MKDKEFNELLQQIENGTFDESELLIDGEEILEQRKGKDALDDKKAIKLANALKKNPNITKLELPSNNIENEGAFALAEVDTLEELILFFNRIKIEGVEALARTNLKVLILDSNRFCKDKTTLEVIQTMYVFNENKTITELNLCNCHVPSEAIAQLIRYNNTIVKLNISCNNLTDEALKYMKYNTTLERLIMYDNSDITNKGLKYISENSSLTHLDLGKNANVNATGGKLIATHSTLKTLSLNSNYLTINEIREAFGPATLFDNPPEDTINQYTDLSGNSVYNSNNDSFL